MKIASPGHRLLRSALRSGAWLALVTLIGGCDEQIDVENARPEVTIDGWCAADERTYLVVTVADPESDPVDLVLCAPEGPAMATGPAGDGLVGLTAEPEGRRHLIEWGSGGDCPCPRGGEPAASACIEPPADGEMRELEIFLADPSHPLSLAGKQTAEPLDACP